MGSDPASGGYKYNTGAWSSGMGVGRGAKNPTL
jgi:hypothetical protein